MPDPNSTRAGHSKGKGDSTASNSFFDFGWLLGGKRTRTSDVSSPENRGYTTGIEGGGKRRNSPPPTKAEDVPRVWDSVLPPPISTESVVTAPISTCSESTLSRAASWSDTNVGSEGTGMIVGGRLHSSSEDHNRRSDAEEETLTVVQGVCDAQGVAVGASLTSPAGPIDIPIRLEDAEPESALHEALRQSLGAMEMRMSLNSARGTRHKRRSSADARPCQTITSVADSASRTIGLPVDSPNEVSSRDGGGSSGLSDPSSFWKSGPSTGGHMFDGPSPSDSFGEGSFFAESSTPRSAIRDSCATGREGCDDGELMFDFEA